MGPSSQGQPFFSQSTGGPSDGSLLSGGGIIIFRRRVGVTPDEKYRARTSAGGGVEGVVVTPSPAVATACRHASAADVGMTGHGATGGACMDEADTFGSI